MEVVTHRGGGGGRCGGSIDRGGGGCGGVDKSGGEGKQWL